MRGAAREKSIGIDAMAGFFVFGASMCSLTLLALLFPASVLESIWRIKPEARGQFEAMGGWAAVLMLAVGIACAVTACGLWRRTRWGRYLALTLLAINLYGDVANAVVRSEPSTLIGLPVGGLMMAYLLVPSVRRRFSGN